MSTTILEAAAPASQSRKGPKTKGKVKRIALMLDETHGVVRQFSAGFYEYVRPRWAWEIFRTHSQIGTLPHVMDFKPDVVITQGSAMAFKFFDNLDMEVIYLLSEVDATGRNWFQIDDEAIGVMAAEHLLRMRYENAACFHYPLHYGARERLRGFTERMKEAGKSVQVYDKKDWRIFQDRLHPTESNPGAADWLRSLPRSTGIFCWHDPSAMMLAENAMNVGISVPEHIGIVGVNNEVGLCKMAWPNLDSLTLPYKQIGTDVGRWLEAYNLGKNPVIPSPYKPTGLVHRKSTTLQFGPPNEELQPVFEAITYTPVRELKMPLLEKVSGFSRRTLQRRFKDHVGTTLQVAMEQTRLNHAEYLLTNSPMSVNEITRACGFATSRSIELIFKKYHNVTPAAYRSLFKEEY